MTVEQLAKVIDDTDKIPLILDVAKDVMDYNRFRGLISLGITIGVNDLPFDKVTMFTLIKEKISGGKT